MKNDAGLDKKLAIRNEMLRIREAEELTYKQIAKDIPTVTDGDLRTFAKHDKAYLGTDKVLAVKNWIEDKKSKNSPKGGEAVAINGCPETKAVRNEIAPYLSRTPVFYREIQCVHCHQIVPGHEQGFHFCGACSKALPGKVT